ncbi:MAG TPA: hypothetical protein VJU59_14760 [Paraburkholderia sp.]|uniref:hypothetical protein n=1 Tax=Paraburkholderia sp. TaxID=1926495 RepID=UPI002B46025F|nr:hypothetical protein [Paraburkholderia sp.]HKR40913.1 hypothetical protein [Paraburkholderia sp.]
MQRHEIKTPSGERYEAEWSQQTLEQSQRELECVVPQYMDARQDNSSKSRRGLILRLLWIPTGFGGAALVLPTFDVSLTTQSAPVLLVGLLCDIGATCYGIAVEWRIFRRYWWVSLFFGSR